MCLNKLSGKLLTDHLANEQKYLASLHDSESYNNNNRYKFHEIDHSQELLASINKANELWSSNEIDKLNL